MARDTLTGSRIRERRSISGLRQADLARQVGISASYLNLIEHNRRRIGGKLLLDIAAALGVEPATLSEGAEAALLSALREAAADSGVKGVETDRADEFAGRFPGWAEVLASAQRRVASLERTVETLSDRLTHDPHLAASLHEVLSTAAAIRSTASILAESDELDVVWRDRFHKNLNQDSLRLAQSSKALVGYLDDTEGSDVGRGIPREEVEAFLTEHGYHFEALEQGTASVDEIIAGTEALSSGAARHIAAGVLARYAADARVMPLAEFEGTLKEVGVDPFQLQRVFGVGLDTIFRRLAAVPDRSDIGLLVCDASGSILFRKPIEGFAIPRFGSGCPLWPVFKALSRPMQPVHRRVEQHGCSAAQFDCFAVAHPVDPIGFDEDPRFHATMLIRPADVAEAQEFTRVGATCRVCALDACRARREPSILSEGF